MPPFLFRADAASQDSRRDAAYMNEDYSNLCMYYENYAIPRPDGKYYVLLDVTMTTHDLLGKSAFHRYMLFLCVLHVRNNIRSVRSL